MKFLHIGSAGAIMIPFVDFVNKNFFPQEHIFLLNPQKNHKMPEANNIYKSTKFPRILIYTSGLWKMYRAKKIFLHGLFDIRLIAILMLQPWLLKKCHWVIWGGDLYDHQFGDKSLIWKTKEFFKKYIIRRFGHLITHIQGDYEFAQKWYGARGQWHNCFMYPSNIYRDCSIAPQAHDGINILLGNSASRTNCHVDALDKLLPFAQQNIRIYCPLSYGDIAYGDEIATLGTQMFGNKFIPLREFMSLKDYFEFLSNIDIAFFNNNRQQGMGNIIVLLGMGKTVYVRSDTTTWQTLTGMGVVLADTKSLELRQLPSETSTANRNIITSRFSESVLIDQFHAILEN